MHDDSNSNCAWNDPETFASPVTSGLPCTCSSEIVIASDQAEAGKWYEDSKWGRVLCCGTTCGDMINAFAVRTTSGRTVMRYIHGRTLALSPVQSW